MSLLEELFGENEAEEAEALERIVEGGSEDDEPRGDDEAEEDKTTVDPTKPKSVRVVKHPRVVLNPARLTGPRGLQALPEHFKDFKFRGKGQEKEDLDLVLKKLEHWAHRLYPKFKFDDCLKKIEMLGNKRPVMVTLRKIRSDQLLTDEIVTQQDSSDDEAAPAPQEDEFDRLLQEQIELAREAHTPRAGQTPKPFPQSAARTPALAPKATSSPSISDEQKVRMLRNKQLAEERRLKKLNTTPTVDLTNFNPAAHLVDTNVSKDIDENVIDITNYPSVIDASNGNKDLSNNSQVIVIEEEPKSTKINSDEPMTIVDISNTIQDVFDTSKDVNSKGVSKNIDSEEVIDITGNINGIAKNTPEVMETIGITEDGMKNRETNSGTVGNFTDNKNEHKAADKFEMQTPKTIQNESPTEADKTHDSLNGSKEPLTLHYTDSSDDEFEVTTYNISVAADVHKVIASQNSQVIIENINNEAVENNKNNSSIEDGNNANEEIIYETMDSVSEIHRDKSDKKEKNNGVEVTEMDFEGTDDDR